MSTKKKPVSHQEQEKPESSRKTITVIILLCFLGIMPLLVWGTLPESSPYTSVTSSSAMVTTAAAAAGMQICSSDAITVNVPGATSAVLYTLAPSCESPDPASVVKFLVLGFSSTDAQYAVIADAQDTHKNWQVTNTEAYTSGYTVMVIQGAPGNAAVQQIGASLIDQGAVRIV